LVLLPAPFGGVAMGVAGVATLILLVWTVARRLGVFEAALRTDQTLGLNERFSTALLLRGPLGEPEQAVLRDAQAHTDAIHPRRSFPMGIKPRQWGAAGTPLLALLAVWFAMPQFDLLARREQQQRQQAAQAIAVETRRAAAERLEAIAKELEAVKVSREPLFAKELEKDLNALARKLSEQKIDVPKAMAEVGKLKDRMESRRQDIEKQLARPGDLQSKGLGKNTREMAKAMQQGAFDKAAAKVEELKQKLQDGSLTDQEKQGLQNELEGLAAQMDKDSPLGKALSEAAEKLGEGKTNESMAGLETAAKSLLDMASLLNEMKSLEALKSEMDAREKELANGDLCEGCRSGGACKGGNCPGAGCKPCEGAGQGQNMGQGQWTAGDNRNQGNGMGAAGIGRGGIAPSRPHRVEFQPTRPPGQFTPGEIIAKMKVAGTQAPGEAKVEYEGMRAMSAQLAEDSIQNDVMPLEHKSLIRDYFAAIKEGDGAPTQ